MRERQRTRKNKEQEREAGATPLGEGQLLEEVRSQAFDFLRAADEALEKAEARRQKPEEFLKAIQQEGGQ